jgi:digeranylgeranylglycerophospholipid reductase
VKKIYDIIVVGGGPGGLTAAMTAAAEGFSVILVDTKLNITRQTRPCCSMWILEPGFHNEAWTFKDEKIYFHRNDFSIPYSGEIVDLQRSVRISSQGRTMVMGKRLMPIAKVIDKHSLLSGLMDEAEKAGVQIRKKTTCLGIEESERGVKARLRHNGSEEWAHGKYLFAADGVDSKVVQSMGLNAKRKLIMQMPVLEHYFADVKTPYPDSWVQFLGDGFNGVSGHLLHKPDQDGHKDIYEVNVVPPVGSGITLKDGMQRLLAHPILKELLSGAYLIKKMGCKWTCWSPIAGPAQNRVILVGDSASFQETENQGAVMCGFRAAKAVEAEERGEKGFEEYNKFWQEYFEFNNPEVLKDTWKGFILRFLGKENIDYIIGLADGMFLDGYVNHFKSGNTIFKFIKSQHSRIEKERPDLADKIRGFDKFKIEDNLIGKV